MGTYTTWDTTAVGSAAQEALIKEDVGDLITNLFPLDTPLQQIIEKRPMGNVFADYPVDTFTGIVRTSAVLAASSGASSTFAKAEGATYTATTPAYPGRLKSVAEIQGRQIAVSDTDRAMNMYGISDRFTFEALKETQTVVNNFEHSFWWSAGSAPAGQDIDSGGGTVIARQTQGLMYWILKSGLERSKIGSNGASPGVAGTAAATLADGHGNNFGTGNTALNTSALTWAYDANGTALDAGMFRDSLMNKWYTLTGRQAGATGFASPRVKGLFAQFALSVNGQINNRNIDAASKMVVDTVDWYETEFGVVSINMSRYLNLAGQTFAVSQSTGSTTVAADEALVLIRPEYYKIGVVRGVYFSPLGKTGDLEQGIVRGEQAFMCMNPQAGTAIVNCIP